jgi:hypothetical protein
MSVFDILKYPISIPCTIDEVHALPITIMKRFVDKVIILECWREGVVTYVDVDTHRSIMITLIGEYEG